MANEDNGGEKPSDTPSDDSNGNDTPKPEPCKNQEVVVALQNLALSWNTAVLRLMDLSRDVCAHDLAAVHLERLAAVLEQPRDELQTAVTTMRAAKST